MVSTKRTIETDQDRFGGFNTRSRDFFSSSLIAEPETLNKTDYSQEDTYKTDNDQFEIEQEYNIGDSALKAEPAENKPIKSFMPTIARAKSNESFSDVEPTQYSRAKINTRGKIFIYAYSLVAIILIAFAVYNTIMIGNLGDSVAAKSLEYNNVQQQVKVLEQKYNDLGASSTVQASLPNSFVRADNNDYVMINLEEKYEIVEIEESTNVFDKICKFISELF